MLHIMSRKRHLACYIFDTDQPIIVFFGDNKVVSGGGKGGMHSVWHSVGGGILRGENMKFWNLASSGELAFALQTVSDILHP